MSVGPRDFGRELIGCARHSPDLEPSEDNVKFRRIANEAESASNLLGTLKASEEEEQIADGYLLVREMTLRSCCLAEDRTPSRGARDRVAAQIRIEMRAITMPDSTAGQVFDHPRDGRTIKREKLSA